MASLYNGNSFEEMIIQHIENDGQGSVVFATVDAFYSGMKLYADPDYKGIYRTKINNIIGTAMKYKEMIEGKEGYDTARDFIERLLRYCEDQEKQYQGGQMT